MDNFVVFLGCNKKQLPYLKKIKKQNYKIILIDKNKKNLGIKISDQYFCSSYLDYKKLNLIYNKIKKKKISNIFTASSQFAHLGASFLAKKIKIPYPTLDSIDICLCKNRFYKIFKKHNLKIPLNFKIKNKRELKKNLKNKDKKSFFYLKSDYGKSPNYLYKGTPEELLKTKINWKKDQYFKKNYILQKNFLGKNLRINVFKKKYVIYDFYTNKLLNINNFPLIRKNNIIKKFINISKDLKMKNWLLKFDLILGKKTYQVLDIGIDPPSRMIEHWKKMNKDFINFYLNLYFNK